MQTIFPCWHNGIKSYTCGGEVQCDVCGSFSGVKTRSYLRELGNGKTQLKLFMTCVSCGSKEVRDNWKGQILKQDIKKKE